MNAIQRFWNGETRIDFHSGRMIAYVLSAILMLGSIASLATRSLNFGLDFTGGTLVEASFPQAIDLEVVRERLAESGLEGALVQHFGSARDVSVRVATREGLSNEEMGQKILTALKSHGGDNVQLRRVDYVGDQVGGELAQQGSLAAFATVVCVMLYVAIRYEWKLAIGSIVGTVHDALLVLGALSFFRIDFDLTALAAVMAMLGYSLNDKVVIFDRVRENFRKMRKGTPLEIMNLSINQTFARTTMTTGLTFIVVLALFLYGGSTLYAFSLALLIGVFSTIYSSIYMSSCLALDIGLSREDLLIKVVEKEGADQNAMP